MYVYIYTHTRMYIIHTYIQREHARALARSLEREPCVLLLEPCLLVMAAGWAADCLQVHPSTACACQRFAHTSRLVTRSVTLPLRFPDSLRGWRHAA
jgi:hypothetical protein